MNNRIHKARASQSLISITSAGIIAFSILMTGYADRSAASEQKASSETVVQRIAPVGAVYVAPAPEESAKEAATTTPTKKAPPQKPKKSKSTGGEAS